RLRQGPRADDPPPADITRVARGDLRKQPPPGSRRDSVGAHDDVVDFEPTAGEPETDPFPVLVEAHQRLTLVVSLGWEHGQEALVDRAPGRVAVQALLLVSRRSVLVEIADVRRRDTDRLRLDRGALDEVPRRRRMKDDPRAEALERSRGALVDLDVAAGVAQQQRRR